MTHARLALLGWLSLLGLVSDDRIRAADATVTGGNGPPSVPSAAGTQPRGGTSTLQAARDLIGRVLPDRAKAVTLELIPADGGRDVFEIEGQGGRVTLRGNNGVALASALNWYLKYSCGCHVSLKARQLRVPSPLPSVQPKIRRVSQDRWRYFLNYCCFGYSLPWYDWTQWEQLIDWMALNGVNAPLAVTGQEAVWLAAGATPGFHGAGPAGVPGGPALFAVRLDGVPGWLGWAAAGDLARAPRGVAAENPRAGTRPWNDARPPGFYRPCAAGHAPAVPRRQAAHRPLERMGHAAA